jgi:hypothetical protein
MARGPRAVKVKGGASDLETKAPETLLHFGGGGGPRRGVAREREIEKARQHFGAVGHQRSDVSDLAFEDAVPKPGGFAERQSVDSGDRFEKDDPGDLRQAPPVSARRADSARGALEVTASRASSRSSPSSS